MILNNVDNAKLFSPLIKSNILFITITQTQKLLNEYLSNILNSQKSLFITIKNKLTNQKFAYKKLYMKIPSFSN